MVYTFDRAGVLKLLEATKKAREHTPMPLMRKGEPGLVLVGDTGIYLMSSRAEDDNVGDANCVFAAEGDPNKLPFDVWRANKRDGFGVDSGAELVDLASAERWAERDRLLLEMEVTSSQRTLRF
jgi:hypothetical protein